MKCAGLLSNACCVPSCSGRPCRDCTGINHNHFWRSGWGSSIRNRKPRRRVGWLTAESQQGGNNGKMFHQGVATAPPSTQPPPELSRKLLGSWWFSMAIMMVTAVGALGSAFTCFVLYIKPLLKSLEDTCDATTEAAKKLEEAAVELEQACIFFQEDVPATLTALEDASREFEELGQNLNVLSGGLTSNFRRTPRRRRKRSRSPPSPEIRESNGVKEGGQEEAGQKLVASGNEGGKAEAEWKLENGAAKGAVVQSGGIQQQTMDGITKVATDINSLARVLTPAMDMWRKQLTKMVTRVEAEQSSEILVEAGKQLEDDSALQWITNWRLKNDTKPEPKEKKVKQQKDEEVVKESKEVDSEVLVPEAIVTDSSHLAARDAVEGVCEMVEVQADYNGNRAPADVENESTNAAVYERNIKGKEQITAKNVGAAVAVMDALYKAEQAAEDAALASGVLQETIKRAQISGAFGELDIFDTDGMAPFLQPDMSGSESSMDQEGDGPASTEQDSADKAH